MGLCYLGALLFATATCRPKRGPPQAFMRIPAPPVTQCVPAMSCYPSDATALLQTTSLSLPDTLDLLPASSHSMVWGGRLTWYLQVGTMDAAGCQGTSQPLSFSVCPSVRGGCPLALALMKRLTCSALLTTLA